MIYGAWLLGGIVVGWLTMATHVWAARRGLLWMGLGWFLRLALVAGLFIVALRVDVMGCLLAFAGLMIARWVLIYLLHRGRVFSGWLG